MDDKISYSELRENLKTHLDKLCSDHTPLWIKRRNGEDVVILPKSDYDSLEETAYLMRSPANAERLLEALDRPPEERKKFSSIEELDDEFGI